MHTLISSPDNLRTAVQHVREKYPLLRDRTWFDTNLDEKLDNLGKELAAGTFKPARISLFYTLLDKPLRCAEMDYRSWVAHEAIVGPLVDYLTKNAVESCTFRPENTPHLMAACRRWKKKNAWVAGADIRRFFDSVQYPVLMEVLAGEISCATTLKLIAHFLEAFDQANSEFAATESTHTYHPNQGLPAGIELVYILANALLTPTDRNLKMLADGYYARYIDDFLFFAPEAAVLHGVMHELESALARLGLTLNPEKTFFQPTTTPFHFLRSIV